MTTFEKDTTTTLKAILDDAIVVQDYPEKYSVKRGKPRAHHHSFTQAVAKGYIFGLHLSSGKHWTRVIMLKPSKALKQHMNDTVGSEINAITMITRGTDEPKCPAIVHHLNGIGQMRIGWVPPKEIEQLEEKAWKVELGGSVL